MPVAVKALERTTIPLGEKGTRMSLERVAKMAAEGRLKPVVRQYAIKAVRDAGLPPGATVLERAAAILAAMRRDFVYVGDPYHAEYMQGADLTIRDFLGGDCFPEGANVLAELPSGKLCMWTVETLEPGMKILGLHDLTEVLAVRSKGMLVVDEIAVEGITNRLHNSFRLTPDHHVYVLECRAHPQGNASGGCPCDRDAREEIRIRVSELRIGMHLPTPHGTRMARVTDLRRAVATLPCWDIQTADNRVFLADVGVTVSQCDDLTITFCAAFLAAAATEAIGARAAIVGHAYDKNQNISHVLAAIFENGNWYYIDPSATAEEAPFGKWMVAPTRERVLDAMTGEVICDAKACLVGANKVIPVTLTRAGDFVGVSGLPHPDEMIEIPSGVGARPGNDAPNVGVGEAGEPDPMLWNGYFEDAQTALREAFAQARDAKDAMEATRKELGLPAFLPGAVTTFDMKLVTGWTLEFEQRFADLQAIASLADGWFSDVLAGSRQVAMLENEKDWALVSLPADAYRVVPNPQGAPELFSVAKGAITHAPGVGNAAIIVAGLAAGVAIYGFLYFALKAGLGVFRSLIERVTEVYLHDAYLKCAKEHGVEQCQRLNKGVSEGHVRVIEAETKKVDAEGDSELVRALRAGAVLLGVLTVAGGAVYLVRELEGRKKKAA